MMRSAKFNANGLKCLTCCERSLRLLGVNPDFQDSNVYLCRSCQLIFTYPMPSDKYLADQYEENYRNAIDLLPNESRIAFMDRRGQTQRDYILKRSSIKPANHLRVLDIGCGVGSLLKAFTDVADFLMGFEPDARVADVARSRLRSDAVVRNQMFNLDCLPAKPFDLVCLSHVFEHVPNPIEFLKSLLGILTRRGILFLEVPNESLYTVREIISSNFRGKMHVLFMNRDSLPKLVAQAGGQTVDIRTFGPHNHETLVVPFKQGTRWRRFNERIRWTMRRARSFVFGDQKSLSINDVDVETTNGIYLRMLAQPAL